ncbi:MAG: DNA polymerase ligase N-terminal domain-containing protein [Candidatus Nanoarchaeia archaeon]|nr:DNA polymerase ligase N-terminal domain-containing protein [Candidatus Nanoarchaeia archaeon]
MISKNFIIQEHHARNLHYDFRLEINGILKSWAVPKNIPTEKGIRRLAIEVEDHPLEYGNFEGIIPKGQYGAGKVTIWDNGKYKNESEKNIETCLKNGHFIVKLEGTKIKGKYAFTRLNQQKNNWIIIKMKD